MNSAKDYSRVEEAREDPSIAAGWAAPDEQQVPRPAGIAPDQPSPGFAAAHEKQAPEPEVCAPVQPPQGSGATDDKQVREAKGQALIRPPPGLTLSPPGLTLIQRPKLSQTEPCDWVVVESYTEARLDQLQWQMADHKVHSESGWRAPEPSLLLPSPVAGVDPDGGQAPSQEKAEKRSSPYSAGDVNLSVRVCRKRPGAWTHYGIKDLPKTLCTTHTGKQLQSHLITSQGKHLLVTYYACMIAMRRRFLENHAVLDYNPREDSLTTVYIPEEYRKELVQQVREDWKLRRYDWERSIRQRDCEEIDLTAHVEDRKLSHDWRSWLALVWGRETLFLIWISFGKITDEHMACVNDIRKVRAAISQEEDKVPASSRDDAEKLTERNRAIELGLTPLPPVKGLHHRQSIPLMARLDARKKEDDFNKWAADMEVRYGQEWSDEDTRYWRQEKEEIEKDWDKAYTISVQSGFGFFDRYGNWIHGSIPENLFAEVIDLYFRVYPDSCRILGVRCGHHLPPAQPSALGRNFKGGKGGRGGPRQQYRQSMRWSTSGNGVSDSTLYANVPI